MPLQNDIEKKTHLKSILARCHGVNAFTFVCIIFKILHKDLIFPIIYNLVFPSTISKKRTYVKYITGHEAAAMR